MKYIFLNLKRFDIPPELGGVNRLALPQMWGQTIVDRTQGGWRLTGARRSLWTSFQKRI